MQLFSRGFTGSSVLQVVLPPLSPFFLIGVFCAAIWKRIEDSWRMLPGIVGLFAFWVFLLPPLLRSPGDLSFVIVFLFFLLVLLLQVPVFYIARNMILRGHGFLAGATLSVVAVALLFSLLVPLGLLIILP